jgi:hypothetical protein
MASPASRLRIAAWNQALADVLLPMGVNQGQPVRLACDDDAIAQAARTLGIARTEAVAALVRALKDAGLVDYESGVARLAVGDAARADPPAFLVGLALLVVAASRMVADERGSMAAYYQRLGGDLLDIGLRDSHPQVAGIRELVARFDDLAAWMAGPQKGLRGVLDLPADVHPPIVGVPINQTLLRAGDRAALGAFFHRAGRLLDAGWDPVNQLRCWAGRHGLTVPLAQLLEHPKMHAALAGALRVAYRSWDGSMLDENGRRILPSQLSLHVTPGRVALGICVPALDGPMEARDPYGHSLTLHPEQVELAPLQWLDEAHKGAVLLTASDGSLIRALGGPTILFEVSVLGMRAVAPVALGTESVWVLTCDGSWIASCPQDSRFHATLPDGWALLCDVDPLLLPADARPDRDPDHELDGVVAVGGLRLSKSTWLLDYPPDITADLPEPAPVSVSDRAYGDLEPGGELQLDMVAHAPGLHHVVIGDQQLTIELASRGQRDGIGSLAIAACAPQLHSGVQPAANITGPFFSGAFSDGVPIKLHAPLLVRYRATVEIIDSNGSTRTLGPPAPAAWLAHVGLGAPEAWEIPNHDRVVWVCVNADKGRFVIAHQPIDVPLTDEVLDAAEWYRDAQTIVDHTDGGALQRWSRIVGALEPVTP